MLKGGWIDTSLDHKDGAALTCGRVASRRWDDLNIAWGSG